MYRESVHKAVTQSSSATRRLRNPDLDNLCVFPWTLCKIGNAENKKKGDKSEGR